MDAEKPSRRDEVHPMQPNKKNHPRDRSIDLGRTGDTAIALIRAGNYL